MKYILSFLLLPLCSKGYCQNKVYNTNLNVSYNTKITGGNVKINNVNNYHNQTIPDSINFGFRIAYVDNQKTLEFYPLDGKWSMPFILYPANAQYTKDEYAFNIVNKQILSVYAGNGFATIDGMSREVIHFIANNVSASFDNKMTVTPLLIENKPDFIVFGDFDDQNKIYLYQDGKVTRISFAGKLN